MTPGPEPRRVNPSGKALFIIGMMSLAGGLVGFWLMHSSNPDTQSHEAEHRENAAANQPTENSLEGPFRAVAPASKKTSVARDGVNEEAPPGSDSWFRDPEIGPDLRFKSVPYIPIQWDGTCSAHPLYGTSDMASLSLEGAQLDPADYFASDALPMQAAQFWIENGRYHQFGFKWDLNTPQTFTLEAYVGDRPDLGDATKLPVEGFSANQSHTYSKIREKMQSLILTPPSAAFQTGARVGRYRTFARQTGTSEPVYHFVALNNGAVTAIEAQELTCTSSQTYSQALCVCQERSRL